MNNYQQQTMTKSQLREQRLQELLNSCQQQVLQQVIGPFGLTPAMFEDKRGGNVTTLHNFNQAVEEAKDPSNTKPAPIATAADQERLNKYIDSQEKEIDRKRTKDYLKEKRKVLIEALKKYTNNWSDKEKIRKKLQIYELKYNSEYEELCQVAIYFLSKKL